MARRGSIRRASGSAFDRAGLGIGTSPQHLRQWITDIVGQPMHVGVREIIQGAITRETGHLKPTGFGSHLELVGRQRARR